MRPNSAPRPASAAPIAVIIPAFNAAPTLSQALASVAGQSMPPAEIIVSDDGSSDDTVAVARSWADQLPVTVLTSTTNGGPSAARRAAIDASGSPVLALLDADDIWLPDHLETLAALHQRHQGLIMADGIRWLPGEAFGTRWTEVHTVPPPPDQLAALYRGNWVISCTLFDRELYDRAGGFRGSLRVGEDWDLWIRMVRAGATVTKAGHPTVLYRMTQGSLMSNDQGIGDRIAVLEMAAAEGRHNKAEQSAVSDGRRLLRAEGHLLAAYRLASEGQTWKARREGLLATRGQRRVAVRGAAMVFVPRTVATRRNTIRSGPGGRLRT